MSDASLFGPPEITDEDVSWAARLLSLRPDAFYGEDGTDPRHSVLKLMTSMDVAACPGSGKTSLLVTKLAILAAKWQYRTRGICVLSHTNAARGEIETKLANTPAGCRLLSYPHYIGTIHGFVNEFLAVPWLRSRGYQIRMIDTEACLTRRWNALSSAIRRGLEKSGHSRSILSVRSPDFGVGEVRWGRGGVLGKDSPTYKQIRAVCQRSCVAGIFCYDEMFVWARQMMDRLPDLVEVVRERFPVLFIDEAQDNTEYQSAILHRIFLQGSSSVIRQRFGDANQAIYHSFEDDEAITDLFPREPVRDLPNSLRFGRTIANLVDPLGLFSCPGGLQGQGPKEPLRSGKEPRHTIFVFEDPHKVLDAYGELLVETFSEQELRAGAFWAVGQVHSVPDEEKAHKHPHHVQHYWPDYDPDLARSDPQPKVFVQYVFAGLGKSEMAGESYFAVEKIAEAVLRLAGTAERGASTCRRRHCHRHLLRLLERRADARESYESLVTRLAVERAPLTEVSWNGHWRAVMRSIAAAISGADTSDSEANVFLEWTDSQPATGLGLQPRTPNVYQYPHDNPKVSIHLGSIHSVKGQTHTATLVLETFWNDHNLKKLIPWIAGRKKGWKVADKVQQKTRLKVHYVAMTRPTHLLCLAMKRGTLAGSNGSLDEKLLDEFEQRGWSIKHV